MTDTQTPPTRSGRRGRGARRDARTAFTQRFLPEMERGIPYLDALVPEQVEIVHDRTMTLLETTGIEFRDDPEIFEDLCATLFSIWCLAAWNNARFLTVGRTTHNQSVGNWICHGPRLAQQRNEGVGRE